MRWMMTGHDFGLVLFVEPDFSSNFDITDTVPCLIQILGWAGYARVDGTTYTFLGVPSISQQKATQKSLEVCTSNNNDEFIR